MKPTIRPSSRFSATCPPPARTISSCSGSYASDPPRTGGGEVAGSRCARCRSGCARVGDGQTAGEIDERLGRRMVNDLVERNVEVGPRLGRGESVRGPKQAPLAPRRQAVVAARHEVRRLLPRRLPDPVVRSVVAPAASLPGRRRRRRVPAATSRAPPAGTRNRRPRIPTAETTSRTARTALRCRAGRRSRPSAPGRMCRPATPATRRRPCRKAGRATPRAARTSSWSRHFPSMTRFLISTSLFSVAQPKSR